MKDSGIEWIGEIPSHWEVRKVKNYYTMQTGFTPDTKNELYYDDIDGYDWVNISDIQDGKIITETKKKISQYYVDTFTPQIIPQGSLLYSFKLSVGQTAYAGKPIYSNEAIASFLPDHNINLHYLRYSSVFIIENAQINIYNAKILNQELINNAYIIFPPLAEQKTIADFLDTKCAEIDAVIEQTKATIEEYKKLKQSIITEAVTKGIRGDRPMKDSGIEWIGKIPVEWDVIRLKYFISGYKAGPFGSSLITDKLNSSGNILVYTPEHIAKKSVDLDKNLYLPDERIEEMQQFIVETGDIIFPIVGSLGRSMLITDNMPQGIINQRLAKFKLDTEQLLMDYFLWLFSRSAFYNTYIELYCRGSIIVNLTKQIVGDMPIPLPATKAEQQEICKYLDEKCSKVDFMIAEKEALIADLEAYRKSLIYEYVTGKKQVIS